MQQEVQATELANVSDLNQTLLNIGSQHTDRAVFVKERQRNFVKASSKHGFVNRNDNGGVFCIGVLSHPDVPNRVWKLVHNEPGYDGYYEYAKWIYNNRIWEQTPHAPRIYEFLEADGVALLSIEELTPLDWETAPQYLKNDWLLARCACLYPPRDIRSEMHRSVSASVSVYGQLDPDHINQPLETYAGMIHKHFADDWFVDLHKDNVMLRGDIMVITDPIAYAMD